VTFLLSSLLKNISRLKICSQNSPIAKLRLSLGLSSHRTAWRSKASLHLKCENGHGILSNNNFPTTKGEWPNRTKKQAGAVRTWAAGRVIVGWGTCGFNYLTTFNQTHSPQQIMPKCIRSLHLQSSVRYLACLIYYYPLYQNHYGRVDLETWVHFYTCVCVLWRLKSILPFRSVLGMVDILSEKTSLTFGLIILLWHCFAFLFHVNTWIALYLTL